LFLARRGPEDRERVLAAGFDAHVSKPSSADELLSVVERLLGTTSALNGSGR
jgi:CheY-like chemotaxis protein